MATTGLYSQHLDNVKVRYLRNTIRFQRTLELKFRPLADD